MKSLTKTIAGSFILCFLAGCGENTVDNFFPLHYLNNQSGHTVSIVHKPSCSEFSDSLVLQHGDSFEFQVHGGSYSSFYYRDFKTQSLYYDNDYEIEFKALQYERRPDNDGAYEYIDKIYIYTFTEADYDYAVENGKSLNTGK